MAFTFRIFMMDLMVFVQDGNDFWTLLPDLSKGATASDGKPIPPHLPVLFFFDASTDGGDWPGLKPLLKLNLPKSGQAWWLKNEDVLLEFTPGVLATSPSTAIGTLPDASNASSFDWTPKMKDLVASQKQINGKLIGKNPPTSIAGRLKLPSPVLETFAFSKVLTNGSIEIRSFAFQELRTPKPIAFGPRAVADVAVAKYVVTSPTVKVSTVKPTGGTVHGPVLLSAAPGKSLDILLANLSPNKTKPDADHFARHFELYYGLSANPSSKGPIPLLSVDGELPDKLEGTEPFLISQTFEDSDAAGAYVRPVCTFAQFEP